MSFDADIIYNADLKNFPNVKIIGYDTQHEYIRKYLNGGGVIGYTDAIHEFYKETLHKFIHNPINSEQMALKYNMNTTTWRIGIDYGCKMFTHFDREVHCDVIGDAIIMPTLMSKLK